MYRHLLVPIDATDRSVAVIGRAVEFARIFGARITFLHAIEDRASVFFGEAEFARSASPEETAYAGEGRARELLAKAESAARAGGVPCSSRTAVHVAPHIAILAAARDAGCDLIFMATRRRRSRIGAALGSQTQRVLMDSPIPVHACVDVDTAAVPRAVEIIRREHRSLAAVLHATRHLLDTATRENALPDPETLRAVLHYIRAFPVALHHPKEERFLFRKLRERTSAVNAELEELERQHVRDGELVAELAHLLAPGPGAATPAPAVVALAVEHYANFIWEHLGREEGVILPAAQRYLQAEDWSEIDAAFETHQDPCFDARTEAEFRDLYRAILELAARAG